MTDYTESRSIIEVFRSRIAASKADGFGVVSRVPVADLEALIDAAERTEKAEAEVESSRHRLAEVRLNLHVGVGEVLASLDDDDEIWTDRQRERYDNAQKVLSAIGSAVQLSNDDYIAWLRETQTRRNLESALSAANTRIAALEEGLREAGS